jgi:hypothetical protein
MSFSDLFDSEFKQRNKGHFSSIVRLALATEFCPRRKEFFRQISDSTGNFSAEYEEI